jgi:hypothetical protein
MKKKRFSFRELSILITHSFISLKFSSSKEIIIVCSTLNKKNNHSNYLNKNENAESIISKLNRDNNCKNDNSIFFPSNFFVFLVRERTKTLTLRQFFYKNWVLRIFFFKKMKTKKKVFVKRDKKKNGKIAFMYYFFFGCQLFVYFALACSASFFLI